MNKSGASAGADGADGAANIPTITVMTPGMQSVQTVISANGSIAARREMPVGVVGEGGEVVRVLVEPGQWVGAGRSEEHTSELQSLMRISYAVFCLKKKKNNRCKRLHNRYMYECILRSRARDSRESVE